MAEVFSGKFNRRYVLKVETTDGNTVTITSPLTLEFQVERTNLSSSNTGSFTIYNLSKQLRDTIFKDQSDLSQDSYLAIQLFAGYDDGKSYFLPRIFNGYIRQAGSYREGPNFKTMIEAFDGYLPSSSQVSATLPKGTPLKDVVKTLTKGFKNIKEQVVGNGFEAGLKKAMSVFGDAMESLKTHIGDNKVYVDDQKAYALAENEVVDSEIVTLSVENGILNTPKKYNQIVEVDCLFEPRLRPSQYLNFISLTAPRLNGAYKVTGISHRGTISGSVGGDCVTTVKMALVQNAVIVYDDSTDTYILENQ